MIRHKILPILIFIFLCGFLVFYQGIIPQTILAQTTEITEETERVIITEEFKPPFQISGFMELIDRILSWLVRIAIPVAVLMILISGIMFLASQGNPSKVTQAKTVFIYTIIGLSVVLIGKGFLSLIISILSLGG